MLTAALLIPIVIGLTWLGGLWFQLMVLLLAALLAIELIDNVAKDRIFVLYTIALATFLGAGVLAVFGYILIALGYGLTGALICMLVAKLSGPRAYILAGGTAIGSAAVVSLIVLRGDTEFGLIALLWLFCVVWSADSMAYFVGRLIGGPKLAPRISPNKTWAGFFGGMVGAALAGFVLARIADVGSELAITTVSAVAAIVAQGGDLQESWAKRQLKIKDSGRLLPGHGGVWDRVDALIVVAIFGLAIGFVRGDGQMVARHLINW